MEQKRKEERWEKGAETAEKWEEKSEILASAAAGEKGKKKKREKFLGSAAGIKGRRFEGIIFLTFSSGWRKKTALVAGFFTRSLGVLALGLHSLWLETFCSESFPFYLNWGFYFY